MENSDYLLNRTVAPAAFPVTLAEMKSDLRVQHDSEDTLIESLIAAATDYMDLPNGAIGKALINQTWKLSVHQFGNNGRVDIPVTPVQSIASITYFDADNTSQALNANDFYLYGDENSAWIVAKSDTSIPPVYNRLDAISITFVAGFGAASTNIPKSISQAIRLLAAHWYEHRAAVVIGTTVTELPMAVESLINLNRKGWVA